jgi:hypothetical protein
LRLEESFLNEFGAVSQCYKFSAMVPKRCMHSLDNTREEDAKSGQYSVLLPEDDGGVALRNREMINKYVVFYQHLYQTCFVLLNILSYLTALMSCIQPLVCLCLIVARYRWNFNPFTANDSDLMQYSVQMLVDFDLVDNLKIDIRKLKHFIMGAHALYHEDAHFHNFKHGWSVMHISYLILRHGASKHLTELDILAVLLAALCHDLDHPGTNNVYEVASKSELALTHSYDAVLERHHSSMTHRLLSSANSNILENLSEEEQTYVQGVITDAILATNMGVHFAHVERLELSSKNDPPFDVTSTSSRRDLVGHIVHAADLSGQALPLELAKVWGDRCLAEFIHQAKQEKLNGYPVTEFMAALETDLQCTRAQVGFVGNIVLPLWTALSTCYPALALRCCQAQSNHDYYAHRIQLEMASQESKESTNTST